MFSSEPRAFHRIVKLAALIAFSVGTFAPSSAIAEPYVWTDWAKNIKSAKPTPVDGYLGRVAGREIKPHKILQILQAKTKNEFCKHESALGASVWACKYTYKIILERPQNDIDNGSKGVLPVLHPSTGLPWKGYKYKLEYVVGYKRRGEFFFTTLKVKKASYPGDRTKLILYIEEGFDPGRYPLFVALYVNRVTLDELSVNPDKWVDWALWFRGVKSPIPDAGEVIRRGLSESNVIELSKLAATATLTVPGRMPEITGLKKKDADIQLRARALEPNPRPKKTSKPEQVGRVIRQGKAPGRYLPGGTLIPYVYGVATGASDDTSTSQPTPIPVPNPITKRFNSPQFSGLPLDWCYRYASGCGRQAAEAYCQMVGMNYAGHKGPDMAPNRTLTIGSQQKCDGAYCGTFFYIDCQ